MDPHNSTADYDREEARAVWREHPARPRTDMPDDWPSLRELQQEAKLERDAEWWD